VLLLLALFVVRPGANRLRTRIVSSISLALGRPVEVSSASLRLLPRPGFELENFVVRDDPAFGAEPIVRARQVTASLRLSSLLRGRLEMARLSLTEPSLNLVRNRQGHWNVEGLLERVASNPVAPTSKASSEVRPAFPYIEADEGRINLKLVHEKRPYALTGAEFALWQDSENTWGMRLEAQPTRTDFNLSDTGLLRVNGSWQRAGSLRETPLKFELQWERAQLGQVTKLAYGGDQGWRGSLRLFSTLNGTPSGLRITAQATVEDFRRYDVTGGSAMSLAARCRASYSTVNHHVSDVTCRAPVGDGMVSLEGDAALSSSPAYDLILAAHGVPIQSLLALGHRASKSLSHDLIAAGQLEAKFRFLRAEHAGKTVTLRQGSGETTDFRVGSRNTKTTLVFGHVPFTVARDSSGGQDHSGVRLDIGPVELALGRPAAATLQGRISRSGYVFQIKGDTELRRLMQAARTVGVPVQVAADGAARVDLQVAGDWSGMATPQPTGKAQLRGVRAEVPGLNAPLEIVSASLVLTAQEIRASNVTASLAHSTWHGTLTMPRCGGPNACPVGFDLVADKIDANEIGGLLSPKSRNRPWYGFFSKSPKAMPAVPAWHATGRLAINRLWVRNLVISHVSSNVQLEGKKLQLSDVRAEVFGGSHRGEWRADFSVNPPQCSGRGELQGLALGKLAEAMGDSWVTGSAAASFELQASGVTYDDLSSSAGGSLRVEVHDGTLPHISLAKGTDTLRVNRFAADFVLRDGKLEIGEGKLETPAGIYQVSGTASLARTLNVKLTRGDAQVFNITGPLSTPRVEQAPSPETQAALKP
jgi:hypothetical protein